MTIMETKGKRYSMNEGDKEIIIYSVQLDLIERELKKALEDIAELRTSETRKRAAKGRCQMLRAALGNARHYLRELENTLE